MLSFCGRVEVVAVVTVMVGGRSRGAGTGGTEAAAGGGVTRGTGAGKGLDPWARPPVRMLQRLSEELLRPDWLLASLPLSCWSRYVSWADSVLLCAVTEMRGLDVPRGGTGGGAFLPLTAKQRREKKIEGNRGQHYKPAGIYRGLSVKPNTIKINKHGLCSDFCLSQIMLKATFAFPVHFELHWHHSVSTDFLHHDTPSTMFLRGHSTRLPGSINTELKHVLHLVASIFFLLGQINTSILQLFLSDVVKS